MGNSAGNAMKNLLGNIAENSVGQGEGENVYLRKAVIGGNYAFGMGDGKFCEKSGGKFCRKPCG